MGNGGGHNGGQKHVIGRFICAFRHLPIKHNHMHNNMRCCKCKWYPTVHCCSYHLQCTLGSCSVMICPLGVSVKSLLSALRHVVRRGVWLAEAGSNSFGVQCTWWTSRCPPLSGRLSLSLLELWRSPGKIDVCIFFNKMLFYRLGSSKYYEIHQKRDVLGVKKLIDVAVCFIGCMYWLISIDKIHITVIEPIHLGRYRQWAGGNYKGLGILTLKASRQPM